MAATKFKLSTGAEMPAVGFGESLSPTHTATPLAIHQSIKLALARRYTHAPREPREMSRDNGSS